MTLAGQLAGHSGEVTNLAHRLVVVVAKLTIKLEHQNINRVFDRENARRALVYRFDLEVLRRPLCDMMTGLPLLTYIGLSEPTILKLRAVWDHTH